MVLLLSAHVAFGQAQSNAADLQGTVTDSTNAVVANATVTARNPATNVSKNATTNDEGFYRLINLPPGDYEVTVEAANFKKKVLQKVTVTVGQRAELNVALEPGQILRVIAHDPGAPEDLPAWSRLTGHPLLRAAHPVYDFARKPTPRR